LSGSVGGMAVSHTTDLCVVDHGSACRSAPGSASELVRSAVACYVTQLQS
jgi:hypothetical protein